MSFEIKADLFINDDAVIDSEASVDENLVGYVDSDGKQYFLLDDTIHPLDDLIETGIYLFPTEELLEWDKS